VVDDAEIKRLISGGQLVEAAGLLERSGEHARAAELHEQLWDFVGAARVARAGGDLPRALRNLLQGRDARVVQELLDEIKRAEPAVMLACAEACEDRGAWPQAAELYAAAGELLRAAAAYEQGGLQLEAARTLEAAGELKRAMERYQQHLDQLVDDTSAAEDLASASYALGRLLLRFGRGAEALPLLQRAWSSNRSGLAGRAVVAALCRLGYSAAAEYALDLLLQQTPPPEAGASLTLRDCLEDPELAPLAEDEGAEQRTLAGRYQLGELLGSGGMGRVYAAVDRLTDQHVAVKVFTAPGGGRGRDAYRKFVREARTTGQLRHPHIVTLLDFHEEMGFMVLEHMAGGTLADRLRPRIEPPICRTVLLQLLSGLTAAHQRGIVHRDIKPSNIFFTAAGAAKLGDFGVAHLQDAGQTQTGAFIGTLAFMSPEQIQGEPVTFATDVYALGVTIFLMLTGQLPFSQPDLIHKHLMVAAPAPSALLPQLPVVCDEVVGRCLAKDPADRFESLEELRLAVERFPTEHHIGGAREEAPAAVEAEQRQRRTMDRRFTVESTLVEAGPVQVLQAQDNQLGRAVALVRIAPGPAREPLLAFLTAAGQGGEHLQHVLSMDAERGQAVLENQLGDPLPLPPSGQGEALRWAEQIGAALAPLHRGDAAHGAISATSLTRCGGVLILALTPALIARTDPQPADDVAATLDLLDLRPEEPLAHGASLVAWAHKQRLERTAAAGAARVEALVEEALAAAPKR
jgi:eukaryotic-like serine/threonine-protein kinase